VKNKEIFYEDLEFICSNQANNLLNIEGKNILVTGATGLIGFTLISALLYYGKKTKNPPKVIALVRNIEKAKRLYKDFPQENLVFFVSDIIEPIHIEGKIDYIIHGASQTSSKAFVNEPVETIKIAVEGTMNVLELAKEKKVKSFVYLSSMEVYGSPESDEKINENHDTNLDTMSVRSSYPEGKRMCESLCTSYCTEYGVPAKVIRLTQTFGPGVLYDDGRVFAEFARCAIEKRNIILHTKGETKRNYLYTADAVTAIFTVLLNGENGEAYNAANEATYCSIYEMAELVSNECTDNQIKVEIQIEDKNKFGYAPTLKMNLDTEKLNKLGWSATKLLCEMFCRLILSLRR
jgi:nucleoside-diphosphate-sugar epimerase